MWAAVFLLMHVSLKRTNKENCRGFLKKISCSGTKECNSRSNECRNCAKDSVFQVLLAVSPAIFKNGSIC